LGAQVASVGEVRAILAPSTCHHLFVADAQRTFPGVPTYAVAGLERKRPDLTLVPLPDALRADEIPRVTIGNRVMREVVLLHRAARTLIATDLVENFRDETPGVDRIMRAWIKMFGMWNKPRPAPELRWLTRDRTAARRALEQILAWDFDRMVIAHGEIFEHGAKDALREAWRFLGLRGFDWHCRRYAVTCAAFARSAVGASNFARSSDSARSRPMGDLP
jgi:hypothetical protein